MSPRARRSLIIVGVGVIAWYVCVLLIWAVQPLSDTIPIGVDHSINPPNGKQSAQTVECNSLFAADARDDVPLPALPEQPVGFDPLVYPREACEDVQRDARIIFGLDTVFTIVVLVGLVFLGRRLSHHSPNAPPGTTPPGNAPSGPRAEVARASMA